jgi:hypothetical protein
LALTWQRRRDLQEDRGSTECRGVRRAVGDLPVPRCGRAALLPPRDAGPHRGARWAHARLARPPRPRSLWSPVSFALDGSLFLQDPGDPPGWEWARYLGLAAYQVRAVAPKTRHVPSARLFVRALSIDSASEHGTGRVDQDVFTPYKDEHQRGVDVEDTLLSPVA